MLTVRMPQHCAAYGCKNRRTLKSRQEGITFHKFPIKHEARRQWEVAMRREGFTSSNSSVLCSKHFKEKDIDMTGQIIRLRDGAVPSIFDFPPHLQQPTKARSTNPSVNAGKVIDTERLTDTTPDANETDPYVAAYDHSYAITSINELKSKLTSAQNKIQDLERQLRNAKDRERRSKKTIQNVLAELKEKNLVNQELELKLERYIDNTRGLVHQRVSIH